MTNLPPARYTEHEFETVIEQHLLDHGYRHPTPPYDAERMWFQNEIIGFIQATQPKEWGKLSNQLGIAKVEEQVLKDLHEWINAQGVLSTLRHGFKCYGQLLRVAFFKPAHGLNTHTQELYQANRLGVMRQLHYSAKHKKSLDMVLTLNGLPMVTIELKNQRTGQTVKDAIKQYQDTRDPRELLFEFQKRALVHFAVDTDEVWMTTRLAGKETHFLPFNRGNNGGAGNPPSSDNFPSAYLWEEVLERDSFLELFGSFIHHQKVERQDENGRKRTQESLIFPRYHQLQAVRLLVATAQAEGTGHNYLIEHSAGSGKSNTIAWLAHRLFTLHTYQDEKVFDSVLVITDRRVLDRQLQDTIYQFEHKNGVVEKIDEDSRQLTNALLERVPIVITTLQKFPYVLRQLIKLEQTGRIQSATLPTRKIAIIVDEAHSSQSGEGATELKGVLGGERLQQEAKAKAEEEGQADLEALYAQMAKRSRQSNLSFFAFTATPKHKTLKLFGRDGIPFHRYTMRQAIEEGYIMDVLRHYTTYKAFFQLVQASAEDPQVERKSATKSLMRYASFHPYNISQKTEVMVQHFYQMTRHKIGGKAKAMVVTDSRLAAVRYKQAFDKYIAQMNYPIKTLVAFSGTVTDDTLSYTEREMNQLAETEVPERFASDDYQVLLVAEKYQTGFDQPLLHTLYIDKRLAGIQAVQTLSRLNRTHPMKEDTFVLDFVNDTTDIQEAFKQYYEGSIMGTEADPKQLYQLKAELEQTHLYLAEELNEYISIYFAPKNKPSPNEFARLTHLVKLAVERYQTLEEKTPEEAEILRGKVGSFCTLYAFLSQVIPYQDSDLEKLYVYMRHLSALLPRRSSLQYDFNDEVSLRYYRLQKISEGSISLNEGQVFPLDGPTQVGTAEAKKEQANLSEIVDIINERFGTQFTQADQLFFDQLIEGALQHEELQQSAKVNSEDKFQLLFGRVLKDLFLERFDQNESIFERYQSEATFQKAVVDLLGKRVYDRLTT